MAIRQVIILLGVLCVVPQWCLAQTPGEVVIPPVEDYGWYAPPPEKFDLVFNRTFLGGTVKNGYSLKNTSGTTFIGTSFNFHLNQRFSVRTQPGVAFVKFNLENDSTAQVQFVPATVTDFRFRVFYLELPVAFGISFRGDSATQYAVKSLLELGVAAGYRVSSSLKYETDVNGLPSKVLTNDVYTTALERYRLGAFLRFNYRFFGLMVYYRFSDIFKASASSSGASYPEFPPLEIGLSIHW